MTSIVTFNILESPAVFLARVNQAGMVIKHFLNNDHSLKKDMLWGIFLQQWIFKAKFILVGPSRMRFK